MSQDLLPGVTGVLALADGTILQGVGCGAVSRGYGGGGQPLTITRISLGSTFP